MSHNHTALITGAQVRIGVAWQGDPTDPAAWSGTLRNLIAGLKGCGLTVRTLRAEIPVVARVNRHLRRGFSEVAGSRLDGPLNSVAARRAISRAGRLEGVVQVGSGYLLPHGMRTVTWEDMTVAQVKRAEARCAAAPMARAASDRTCAASRRAAPRRSRVNEHPTLPDRLDRSPHGAPPDPDAVLTFLRAGYQFGARTLWQGVERLEPATALRLPGTVHPGAVLAR